MKKAEYDELKSSFASQNCLLSSNIYLFIYLTGTHILFYKIIKCIESFEGAEVELHAKYQFF